jgi:hypothetical protein
MQEYRWTLLKTLEFLNSRRPDLEIRATFIKQLSDYESRLRLRGLGPQTAKWDEIAQENRYLESEELMLRNTFLNAQSGPMAKLGAGTVMSHVRHHALRWRDQLNDKPISVKARSASRLPLATLTEARCDLVNLDVIKPQVNHRRAAQLQTHQPIMRRSRSFSDVSQIYPSVYARDRLN